MRRLAVFRPVDVRTCVLLFGAVAAVLGPRLSYGRTFEVRLMRVAESVATTSKSKRSLLRGIHWEARTVPVSGSKLNPIVRIRASYLRKNWTLAFEFKDAVGTRSTRLLLRPSTRGARSFEIDLPIFGKKTPFRLWAKGPNGEHEELRLVAVFNDWQAFEEARKPSRLGSVEGPSRFSLTGGLGVSSFSFQQEGAPDYSDLALMGLLSVKAWIVPSRWDFEAGGDMTFLSLTSNPSSTSLQRLRANARIGYAVPSFRDPWRIVFGGGVQYSTTIVPGDEFGYKSVLGPEVSVALTRSVSQHSVLSAFAGFSPISSGLSFPEPSNWEFQFQLSWGWKAENSQHRRWQSVDLSDWRLSFDYRVLRLKAPASLIHSRSANLGLSYSW